MKSQRAAARVVVGIATYRRPSELETLLRSLVGQGAQYETEILVVDNDARGTARSIVEAMSTEIQTRYVIEPVPGIAAARNRALDESADADFLVFVDDDEIATDGWLSHLVDFALSNSAIDVVYGQVRSEFPQDAPPWVIHGGFVKRRELTTGQLLQGAATNNTLLRLASWRRLGCPRFDLSFSATGGSDSDFFSRLRRSGLTIQACAEAVIREPIDTSRVTPRWIARRGFRNGVVLARIWSQQYPRVLVMAKGFWWFVTGVIAVMRDLMTVRRVLAPAVTRTLNGVGILAGPLGTRVHEYRRS